MDRKTRGTKTVEVSKTVWKDLNYLKTDLERKTIGEVIEDLLKKRTVILGHFTDLKKNWFIAWGDNVTEAWAYVDSTLECPEMESIKVLDKNGFVIFKIEIPDNINEQELTEEDIDIVPDHDENIFYGDDGGEAESWILERLKVPDADIQKRREESNRIVEEIDRKTRKVLTISEMMIPEFIQWCSKFETYAQLMEKGGFQIIDTPDIEQVDRKKLDKYIKEQTEYLNWDMFLVASAQFYLSKKRQDDLEKLQ